MKTKETAVVKVTCLGCKAVWERTEPERHVCPCIAAKGYRVVRPLNK